MSTGERCRWRAHLDLCAGVLDLPEFGEVRSILPMDTYSVGGTADRVSAPTSPSRPSVHWEVQWESIALLLADREANANRSRWEPFAYSRRFATAWSGQSEWRTRAGIEALRRMGVLIDAGEIVNPRRRPTPLYRVRGVCDGD